MATVRPSLFCTGFLEAAVTFNHLGFQLQFIARYLPHHSQFDCVDEVFVVIFEDELLWSINQLEVRDDLL